MKARWLAFDYLRAVAIILIVLGHSVYNSEKGFPVLLENIIRGGTAVFVFISGYFLHAVFSQNFQFQAFLLKKWKGVVVPFLFVSFVGLVFKLLGWWWLDGLPLEKVALNLFYTVKNFYVLYPHWYIPFIMVVFLLSPLYLAYLQLPLWRQLLLFALFSILAVMLHRPHGNAGVIQSLLYYTPFYLLGMLFSLYRVFLIKHYKPLLLVSALLFMGALIMQTWVVPWVGNYHKWFFKYRGIDFQFVQKVGLCILLLALCYFLSKWQGIWLSLDRWLREVGELSFAIFFIHPLLTLAMNNLFPLLGWYRVPGGAWFSVFMTCVVFCIHFLGSFYIARAIRYCLPYRSRWLIGA